jgi:hypothetical protein
LTLTSPTSGGGSVGIVRLRTTGHGFCLFVLGQVSLINSKVAAGYFVFYFTDYFISNPVSITELFTTYRAEDEAFLTLTLSVFMTSCILSWRYISETM